MENPQLTSENNFEHYYTNLPIVRTTFPAPVVYAGVVIDFTITCSTKDNVTINNLIMILDFFRFIIISSKFA